MKNFQQLYNLLLNQYVKSISYCDFRGKLCIPSFIILKLKIFNPLGAALGTHFPVFNGIFEPRY